MDENKVAIKKYSYKQLSEIVEQIAKSEAFGNQLGDANSHPIIPVEQIVIKEVVKEIIKEQPVQVQKVEEIKIETPQETQPKRKRRGEE